MTAIRNDPRAGSLILVIVLALSVGMITGETANSSLSAPLPLLCAVSAFVAALAVGMWLRHKWLKHHQ